MSIELDESNNISNSFDLDPTSDLLDEHETTLHENQEFSNDFLNNSAYTDDIQASLSDKEIVQEFSNEAYADLMVLVTKYKLSNTAGNAIISFFNKHSKHSKLPLPKNIKQGKKFMNNIKSNLSYKKTKVLELDNTEYFLYHMDLISYIESKLEIPDIAQHLEFEYKELYKTTENGKEITHKEQNNGMCDINIYKATVIDRMHHLDLGLFKHQINFILDLLKEQYGASILNKIDNRLANIPRFPGLRILKMEFHYLPELLQVQKQAVASKLLSRKPKNFKTITPFKFTNLIWTIYLLLNAETTEENALNLALIWWYDFKSTNDSYYYGCPRLKKTELYNIVNIEAIKNHVHIIPCFDKSNDYLVNKYIF
ncbi:zn-finger domain-containing protein [Gigaspora margarita]|uniref:Zn-finger domain-containing protein n=1 Tax=Gigaspora margarita TaxID=4874 RepID=A0A8H3XB47_GIGMA|nr:zn-finger domain-containing protein [Gigaspora margarita]